MVFRNHSNKPRRAYHHRFTQIQRNNILVSMDPSEPLHASPNGFNSLLEELESAREHVQDRIRRLEAITSRARQYERQPPIHTPIHITNPAGQGSTPAEASNEEMQQRVEIEEGDGESGRGCKRKSAHLVARALEIETGDTQEEEMNETFFDCNICLDRARDPVLTCCGHLYCWPCFYQVKYAYTNARECPVCKGEVTDSGIIPIYGNGTSSSGGSSESGFSTESGLRVPPRPTAPRTESVRQQLISQGASSSVIQNIRRFNHLLNGRVASQSLNAATDRYRGLIPQPHHPQTSSNGHGTGFAPSSISNLLVHGATSFSSLSSALNSAMDSAERLVEDIETYIHHGLDHHGHHHVYTNSTHNGNVAAVYSTAPASASPFINVYTSADIGSQIQISGTNIQIETTLDSSSGQDSNDRRRRRSR